MENIMCIVLAGVTELGEMLHGLDVRFLVW